jgi:Ni,Fe-hydrogenase III component G
MNTSMPPGLDVHWTALAGPLPVWRAGVAAEQLVPVCRRVHEDGGRLVSLWGEVRRDADGIDTAAIIGYRLCVVLETADRLLLVEVPLPVEMPGYPDLSVVFPSAARMQRAAHDLLGLIAVGGDGRPWLRHMAWPADVFPLRNAPVSPTLPEVADGIVESYPFVRVTGDGVHEIAVGPVHAGIIEPGHFRFSVVGEKVLRLEERLGYTHKGVEQRFQGMSLVEGARLAARICGDSTVAFAWAYAMAAEALTATRVRWRCEPCCWNANASPTTWAISARSATTAAWRSAWRSSRASRKTCCGPTPGCGARAIRWTRSRRAGSRPT